MKDIIIVGAGSWTKNLIEFLGRENIAYVYDEPKEKGEECWGLEVSNRVTKAPIYGYISSIGDPRHKRELVRKIEEQYPDPQYTNYIHESCTILPSAKIGVGVYMQPQNIVYANTTIGDHVSLCGACNIGHDTKIGDFCTLSPRTLICGNVTVGEGVFFGVGACVLPNIKIGRGSKIGAGAVVNRDISPNSIALGMPARSIKGIRDRW